MTPPRLTRLPPWPHARSPTLARLRAARAAPHHVYALGDVRKVVECEGGDGAEATFMFVFNDCAQHAATSATPAHLVCASETRTLMHRWLSGVQARLQRQQEPGAARARTIWVDTYADADDDSHGRVVSDADGDSDDDDDDDDDDAARTRRAAEVAPPTPRTPRAGAPPAALTKEGRPRAQKIGVRYRNLPWSPIGVHLEHLHPGPGRRAGLRVGDIVVAVNGQACFSHMHACRLMGESANPVELIVWSPPTTPAAAAAGSAAGSAAAAPPRELFSARADEPPTSSRRLGSPAVRSPTATTAWASERDSATDSAVKDAERDDWGSAVELS